MGNTPSNILNNYSNVSIESFPKQFDKQWIYIHYNDLYNMNFLKKYYLKSGYAIILSKIEKEIVINNIQNNDQINQNQNNKDMYLLSLPDIYPSKLKNFFSNEISNNLNKLCLQLDPFIIFTYYRIHLLRCIQSSLIKQNEKQQSISSNIPLNNYKNDIISNQNIINNSIQIDPLKTTFNTTNNDKKAIIMIKLLMKTFELLMEETSSSMITIENQELKKTILLNINKLIHELPDQSLYMIQYIDPISNVSIIDKNNNISNPSNSNEIKTINHLHNEDLNIINKIQSFLLSIIKEENESLSNHNIPNSDKTIALNTLLELANKTGSIYDYLFILNLYIESENIKQKEKISLSIDPSSITSSTITCNNSKSIDKVNTIIEDTKKDKNYIKRKNVSKNINENTIVLNENNKDIHLSDEDGVILNGTILSMKDTKKKQKKTNVIPLANYHSTDFSLATPDKKEKKLKKNEIKRNEQNNIKKSLLNNNENENLNHTKDTDIKINDSFKLNNYFDSIHIYTILNQFIKSIDNLSLFHIQDKKLYSFYHKKNEINEIEEKEVWTCGQNAYGELGHDDFNTRKVFNRVLNLDKKNIIEIAAGNEHTLVLTNDGIIYSCGYNDNGQCGQGITNRIPNLTMISKIDNVKHIYSYNGCEHSFLVNKEGKIASFGYNYRGQLGHNTTTSEITPRFIRSLDTKYVYMVSCSYYHTVLSCINSTNNINETYSFGRNDYGQLGHNDTIDKKIPHLIDSLIGISIRSMGCGQYHSIVVTGGGEIYGCGKNDYGQIGLETTDIKKKWTTIHLPNKDLNCIQITCGYYHTMAICNEQKVFAFGRNDYGQLGIGHTNSDLSQRVFIPHPVIELNNKEIIRISCGCYHTIAIAENGLLFVFGRNNHGQLGTGDTTERYTPHMIDIFLGKKILMVAAGFYHTIVLTGWENNEINNDNMNELTISNGLETQTSSLDTVKVSNEHSIKKKIPLYTSNYILSIPKYTQMKDISKTTLQKNIISKENNNPSFFDMMIIIIAEIDSIVSDYLPIYKNQIENKNIDPIQRLNHFIMQTNEISSLENKYKNDFSKMHHSQLKKPFCIDIRPGLFQLLGNILNYLTKIRFSLQNTMDLTLKILFQYLFFCCIRTTKINLCVCLLLESYSENGFNLLNDIKKEIFELKMTLFDILEQHKILIFNNIETNQQEFNYEETNVIIYQEIIDTIMTGFDLFYPTIIEQKDILIKIILADDNIKDNIIEKYIQLLFIKSLLIKINDDTLIKKYFYFENDNEMQNINRKLLVFEIINCLLKKLESYRYLTNDKLTECSCLIMNVLNTFQKYLFSWSYIIISNEINIYQEKINNINYNNTNEIDRKKSFKDLFYSLSQHIFNEDIVEDNFNSNSMVAWSYIVEYVKIIFNQVTKELDHIISLFNLNKENNIHDQDSILNFIKKVSIIGNILPGLIDTLLLLSYKLDFIEKIVPILMTLIDKIHKINNLIQKEDETLLLSKKDNTYDLNKLILTAQTSFHMSDNKSFTGLCDILKEIPHFIFLERSFIRLISSFLVHLVNGTIDIPSLPLNPPTDDETIDFIFPNYLFKGGILSFEDILSSKSFNESYKKFFDFQIHQPSHLIDSKYLFPFINETEPNHSVNNTKFCQWIREYYAKKNPSYRMMLRPKKNSNNDNTILSPTSSVSLSVDNPIENLENILFNVLLRHNNLESEAIFYSKLLSENVLKRTPPISFLNQWEYVANVRQWIINIRRDLSCINDDEKVINNLNFDMIYTDVAFRSYFLLSFYSCIQWSVHDYLPYNPSCFNLFYNLKSTKSKQFLIKSMGTKYKSLPNDTLKPFLLAFPNTKWKKIRIWIHVSTKWKRLINNNNNLTQINPLNDNITNDMYNDKNNDKNIISISSSCIQFIQNGYNNKSMIMKSKENSILYITYKVLNEYKIAYSRKIGFLYFEQLLNIINTNDYNIKDIFIHFSTSKIFFKKPNDTTSNGILQDLYGIGSLCENKLYESFFKLYYKINQIFIDKIKWIYNFNELNNPQIYLECLYLILAILPCWNLHISPEMYNFIVEIDILNHLNTFLNTCTIRTDDLDLKEIYLKINELIIKVNKAFHTLFHYLLIQLMEKASFLLAPNQILNSNHNFNNFLYVPIFPKLRKLYDIIYEIFTKTYQIINEEQMIQELKKKKITIVYKEEKTSTFYPVINMNINSFSLEKFNIKTELETYKMKMKDTSFYEVKASKIFSMSLWLYIEPTNNPIFFRNNECMDVQQILFMKGNEVIKFPCLIYKEKEKRLELISIFNSDIKNKMNLSMDKIISKSTIASNKWIYVVITYEENKIRLYLDGMMDSQKTFVSFSEDTNNSESFFFFENRTKDMEDPQDYSKNYDKTSDIQIDDFTYYSNICLSGVDIRKNYEQEDTIHINNVNMKETSMNLQNVYENEKKYEIDRDNMYQLLDKLLLLSMSNEGLYFLSETRYLKIFLKIFLCTEFFYSHQIIIRIFKQIFYYFSPRTISNLFCDVLLSEKTIKNIKNCLPQIYEDYIKDVEDIFLHYLFRLQGISQWQLNFNKLKIKYENHIKKFITQDEEIKDILNFLFHPVCHKENYENKHNDKFESYGLYFSSEICSFICCLYEEENWRVIIDRIIKNSLEKIVFKSDLEKDEFIDLKNIQIFEGIASLAILGGNIDEIRNGGKVSLNINNIFSIGTVINCNNILNKCKNKENAIPLRPVDEITKILEDNSSQRNINSINIRKNDLLPNDYYSYYENVSFFNNKHLNLNLNLNPLSLHIQDIQVVSNDKGILHPSENINESNKNPVFYFLTFLVQLLEMNDNKDPIHRIQYSKLKTMGLKALLNMIQIPFISESILDLSKVNNSIEKNIFELLLFESNKVEDCNKIELDEIEAKEISIGKYIPFMTNKFSQNNLSFDDLTNKLSYELQNNKIEKDTLQLSEIQNDSEENSTENIDKNSHLNENSIIEKNNKEFIENLMTMGFPESWCIIALKEKNNDTSAASSWIVDNIDYLAELSETECNTKILRVNSKESNNSKTTDNNDYTNHKVEEIIQKPLFNDKDDFFNDKTEIIFSEIYFNQEQCGFASTIDSTNYNKNTINIDHMTNLKTKLLEFENQMIQIKEWNKFYYLIFNIQRSLSILYSRCIITLLLRHIISGELNNAETCQKIFKNEKILKLIVNFIKSTVFSSNSFYLFLLNNFFHKKNQLYVIDTSLTYEIIIEKTFIQIAKYNPNFGAYIVEIVILKEIEKAAYSNEYENILWTAESSDKSTKELNNRPKIELVYWFISKFQSFLFSIGNTINDTIFINSIQTFERFTDCFEKTNNLSLRLICIFVLTYIVKSWENYLGFFFLNSSYSISIEIFKKLCSLFKQEECISIQSIINRSSKRLNKERLEGRLYFSKYFLGLIDFLLSIRHFILFLNKFISFNKINHLQDNKSNLITNDITNNNNNNQLILPISSYPCIPYPPRLLKSFENSFILSWRPPKLYSTLIHSYNLEMKQYDTDDQPEIIYSGKERTFQIDHLLSDTLYEFRLQTITPDGSSGWSRSVGYQTLLKSGNLSPNRKSIQSSLSMDTSFIFDYKYHNTIHEEVFHVSKDHLTLTYQRDDCWTSILGMDNFVTGKNKWEIRIDHMDTSYLFIGIATKHVNYNSFLGSDDQSWGFLSDKALYFKRNKIKVYGDTFGKDDIIGVILDVDEGTLSFEKNGTDLGIAFENLSGEFYPAISFYSKNQKIALIKSSFDCPGLGISILGNPIEITIEDIIYITEIMQILIHNDYNNNIKSLYMKNFVQEAYNEYIKWFNNETIRLVTKAGYEIQIDISDQAFKDIKSDFRTKDMIQTPNGKAEIIGVADNKIWYLLEGEKYIWFFGVYDILSNKISLIKKNKVDLSPTVLNETKVINNTTYSSTRPSLILSTDNIMNENNENDQKKESMTLEEYESLLKNDILIKNNTLIENNLKLIEKINEYCEIHTLNPWNLSKQIFDEILTKLNLIRSENKEKDHLIYKKYICHYTLIRYLNHKLASIISLIDLSNEIKSPYHFNLFYNNEQNLEKNLTISQCISSLRGSIYYYTKYNIIKKIMEKTMTKTKMLQDDYDYPEDLPQVVLNRPKAAVSKYKNNLHIKLSESLFGQLFDELNFLEPNRLRITYSHPMDDGQLRSFKVKFEGEGVDDYGGPYRECFSQLSNEIQSTMYYNKNKNFLICVLPLLQPCPNWRNNVGQNREKFIINPSFCPTYTIINNTKEYINNHLIGNTSLYLEMYHFLGKILGIAFRTKVLIRLDFSCIIWKYLVGEIIYLNDLELIDTSTGSFIQQINEMKLNKDKHEDLNELLSELTFTTHLSDGVSLVELCNNGRNIQVNMDNVDNYLFLLIEIRLNESNKALNAIKEGFTSIIPSAILPLLTWKELELQICGKQEIDIDLLEKNTEYDDDISNQDDFIIIFWRVLRSFNEEDKCAFLRFVWARSRLPLSSQDFHQKFKIQPFIPAEITTDNNPDHWLPKSHTCFFSLSLPKYTNDEICSKQLLYAIRNCVEMDGDFRMTENEMTGWDTIQQTDQINFQ